uniref:Uncharacterized protein n=1 Tax=Anguilla anguilla TaxID=7936 RepID=A0A0E9WL94_ANGAN
MEPIFNCQCHFLLTLYTWGSNFNLCTVCYTYRIACSFLGMGCTSWSKET